MMTKTYVIDDEFFAVDILRDHIGRTPGLELMGTSTEPLQALHELSTTEAPDIVFIDVEMPSLSGLELAKLLAPKVKFVFTTSHRQFGPEAFELGAADYLLKPITYERFLACITRIRTENISGQAKAAEEPFTFFVKTDMKGKLVRIIADDILYISSEHNYVNIHLKGEKVKAYLTMAELSDQLPEKQFCRTHRSFIVNMDRIRIMEAGILRLDDGAVVDIGPKFKEHVLERLGSKLIVSYRQ
jgi:two-component system LytT family response regulator